MTWTYVLNEADESYCLNPPRNLDHASKQDLPDSEFQMRTLLYKWMMDGFVKYQSHGRLARLTNGKQYIQDSENLAQHDFELRSLVESSDVHRSALLRILSVMPDDVPQKAYLLETIIGKMSA